MKLIDKSALVAEIERIKKEECPTDSYEGRCKLLWFEQFLSFLDTIETKEVASIWNDARKTIPEDSSNQIICIKEDDLAIATIGKLVRGTKKWAYLNDLLNISNVETKDVDLEEEITNIEYIRKDAFIEKATEWLCYNYDKYIRIIGSSVYPAYTELCKDFQKAMEE